MRISGFVSGRLFAHPIMPVLPALFCLVISCGQKLKSVPDNSLKIKDYLNLGVPSLESSWTSGDYRTAAQILKKLGDKNPTQLPRHNSPNSGRLFRKIVDTLNFNYRINETNLPELFALNLVLAMRHIQKIQKLYLVPMQKGHYFSAELTELINMIYFLADRVNTYSEIGVFGRLTSGSPKQNQMLAGLSNIIQGSLAALEDPVMMEKSARERLSRYVEKGITRNFFRLRPKDKSLVRDKILQLLAVEGNSQVKSALERTLARI
jgi:hypothetical protein